MEKIKDRYNTALQTLITLKEALDKLKSGKVPEEYIIEVRDSVIQRFEYSIDTFWKFLKVYLQDHLKVTLEATVPRAIIREALTANLLSEQDSLILMKSITSRNETSHTYNESLAQEVVNNIPEYYEVMHKILQNIPIIKIKN
jgi:nucleotidyltransferase substrate binding protein (TIGR01987 family)